MSQMSAFAAALAAAEPDCAGFAILGGAQLRLPDRTGLAQEALAIESGASITRTGEIAPGLSHDAIRSRNG